MKSSIFLALFFVFLLFFPILSRPQILLARGNDLENFFWPILYFTKERLLIDKELPLWNTLWFSGTPLLPDPQSLIFYLPNAIFLLFPIDAGIIISAFIHSFMGGFGAYLVAKRGLGFSKFSSLFVAAIYIHAPRFSGYLEAGHLGLINSAAWFPFVILSVINLLKNPSLKWSMFLAGSLAAIFYNHILTFLITLFVLVIFWSTLGLIKQRKNISRSFFSIVIAGILTFGIIAIQLLPQLMWKDETTRFLLLNEQDVYPKWSSLREFLNTTFLPWSLGKDGVWNTDPEKWTPFGVFVLFFASFGFLKLERPFKIVFSISMLILVLIALNNVSPIYSLLLSQEWYVLLRVSTRVWFILVILITFLAGYGLDSLYKERERRTRIKFIASLAIVELVALSWIRISTPIAERQAVTSDVYSLLKNDDSIFRVFCVTRCIPQKEAAKYNLQLVEGYGTLQQKNYYNQFIQLSQVFWDKYTLALPPFEIYKFREIQTYTPDLSNFNTKYVISPYKQKDPRLIKIKESENYFVYLNTIVKPRAYFLVDGGKADVEAKILKYTPNHIQIDTSQNQSKQIVLAEVYSPGWKAFLDGKKEIEIKQTRDALRLVDIDSNTKFIDFKYQPLNFETGKSITISTIFLLLFVGLFNLKNELEKVYRKN